MKSQSVQGKEACHLAAFCCPTSVLVQSRLKASEDPPPVGGKQGTYSGGGGIVAFLGSTTRMI